ncbi:MAG: S8 family serine peptidase [Acidobacteria bacterium]|nr:S8 family serine peptidase [Acidobacteriota bacterium]
MKQHIVLKLHTQLADDTNVPNWLDFITDKSAIRESVTPDVDRLLSSLGLTVWLTKEYKPAQAAWTAEERREGLNRTYRMILQHDYSLPDDLVERIKLIPSVEDARGLVVGAADLPAPAVSAQASFPGRTPADLIHLRYAQALTKGVSTVRIAVLDTGLNLAHKELSGKAVQRADFVDLEGLNTSEFIGDFSGYDDVPEDEVGHGTHVAGIVAGRGLQMDEGVAPGCGLMAVRVLATMKSGTRLVGAGIVDNINAGIKWAVDNGADVINMSLGIKHLGGGLPHADVIRYALDKNVTVVAASGNDGTAERYYPGALPGVIAVGAVDHSGSVASFTSFGANISVVAPGVNIYSAFARNTYAFASGTSQAAPFVCGMVGLMKSYAAQLGRRLTNGDIRHVLRHTSDKVDHRLRNEHAGYGLVNMADAFKLLAYELA